MRERCVGQHTFLPFDLPNYVKLPLVLYDGDFENDVSDDSAWLQFIHNQDDGCAAIYVNRRPGVLALDFTVELKVTLDNPATLMGIVLKLPLREVMQCSGVFDTVPGAFPKK